MNSEKQRTVYAIARLEPSRAVKRRTFLRAYNVYPSRFRHFTVGIRIPPDNFSATQTNGHSPNWRCHKQPPCKHSQLFPTGKRQINDQSHHNGKKTTAKWSRISLRGKTHSGENRPQSLEISYTSHASNRDCGTFSPPASVAINRYRSDTVLLNAHGHLQ